MKFWLPDFISKSVFYPLWDIYDGSAKLAELARLKRDERLDFPEKARRQEERLLRAVNQAYRDVPFYRARGVRQFRTVDDFKKVPFLSKADVRAQSAHLLSEKFDKRGLQTAKTGGSTGVSLELFFDKRCGERRNAAALWADGWAGWDLGAPVGCLWGNPPAAATFKQKVRRQALDRKIYLDTVDLHEGSMAAFIKDIRRNKIRFLFGHAHSLYLFAKFVEKNGADLPMQGVVSTSMMLLPNERRTIETALACRVSNRYGCEEVGLIACECEAHNGLHINMDHVYVEILKSDGATAQPGEEGDVVVTDLNNAAMPLIRYRVGDRAAAGGATCACGRTAPKLAEVRGRTADFLLGGNGHWVAGVSLVERTLTAIPGIEQMQIVQETKDNVTVRIVPDSLYSADSEARLLAEMKRALGDNILYAVEKCATLQQDANGKYRFAVSKIEGA